MCGHPRVATADIRAGLALHTVAADTHAGLILATADIAEPRATADRGVHLSMAVAEAQVAAGTIQRRVVDIIPAADIPPADTPAAADTLVVAAIPVVADMAEVIAKKLGDGKSLREAAT